MSEIIGIRENLIKFEIDPLSAASSRELTALMYSCQEENKMGLILGFYGLRINANGVPYESYAFKNLSTEKALDVMNKLDNYIEEESKYLLGDAGENNIYFQFDDITFLVSRNGHVEIRVFWNGFDSEWGYPSFSRTKKRFERKIEKG